MLNKKENSGLFSRAHGAARMVVLKEESNTAIRERYYSQPYRLMFPTPENEEVLQVVLSNLSGGMLNGDRYDLDLFLGEQTDMLFTGQAAEKIYKAADHRVTEVYNRITVEDGAKLEWLPQGTIQFDGARMNRLTEINLAPAAQLIAGEILYLGRTAMGERLTSGELRDVWTIRRDNKLLWEDRMVLNARNMAGLQHEAGLAGAPVTAMLFYAGPDAADWLEPLREKFTFNGQGARFGISLVNGILLMRWLGDDGQVIRQQLGEIAAYLRQEIMGRPARLPRIWHI